MSLAPLYHAVAWLVVHIHSGLSPVFGADSGASWALSIVLLTMAMRLVLFPLFVKQIRNQRAMTVLQPKMKELQAKYKNDKERLNQEMMALWKEAGANPFSGCLPLLLQIPIFIALFHVLNAIKPNKACTDAHNIHCYTSSLGGFPQHLIASAANAKVFGVPIAAAFTSNTKTLHLLGASATSTKVLTAALIVIMGLTTFITQRQLMARNAATADSQMAQQQKLLLYVLPFTFGIFGFRFPLGVLLYWLTTNLWSMGQQAIVIRRMDTTPAAATATGPAGPAPGAKPTRSPAAGGSPGAASATPAPTPPRSSTPTAGGKPGGKRRPATQTRRARRGRR